MKKFLLSTLLFWLVAFTSQAQINNLAPVWADVFSGSGTATGNKVAVGANGNVYTIGDFTGSVDFDPSPVVQSILNAAAGGVFVVATNPTGTVLWAQQIPAGLSGRDIAVSTSNNNIYVTGIITGSGMDAFVTSLNPTTGGSFFHYKKWYR